MGCWHALLLHVLLVTVVARAPAAHAWRKEGHYMVCKIAESFLTSEASAAVARLLPEWAGELAETCSWADDERRRYPWSGALHFADTPGDCQFFYDRDCHNTKGEKDMCVVGGINNYTAALMNSSAPLVDPTISLMFLAHFLGDIHQPLHCGNTVDYGGNTIVVNWYNNTTTTNLHRVWDMNIIQKAMKDFYNDDLSIMTQVIMKNITVAWSDEQSQWEACPGRAKTCADKYATESARLSCDVAYAGVEQGSILGDEYFFSALPVVQKRIAQGGVRLAALLNRIFGEDSRPQSS